MHASTHKNPRLASEWCSAQRNPHDPPMKQCYKSIHQLIKQTLCPDIRNAEVIPRALCQYIAIAIITAFPYELERGGSRRAGGRRVECLFDLFPSVNMWHIQIKCPPFSLIVFCWRFFPHQRRLRVQNVDRCYWGRSFWPTRGGVVKIGVHCLASLIFEMHEINSIRNCLHWMVMAK